MTTPNLAIQNVNASHSATIQAAEPNSARRFRFWAPRIQLLCDFVTIESAIWLIVWLFPLTNIGRNVAGSQRMPIVISAAALGVALIFRHTSRHIRVVTPLHIRQTEALLRAVGFSFLLLVVAAHQAGWAGKRAALCAALALGFLLLQRHVGRLAKGWALRRDFGEHKA